MPSTSVPAADARHARAVGELPASPRITIVIPTRNEEGMIGEVIDSVKGYGDHVLVIDGHSSDRTRDVAVEHGAQVMLDGGKGKGEAIRMALAQAPGDVLVFIDADGSHEPRDIPAMLAPILAGQADMVGGSRGKGGSDELHGTAEQLIRYVGSQLIMLAINYRWKVRLTDSQNGFRAIRKDVGLALGLRSNLTTIEQEMIMRALKLGFRVSEIPSHEFERRWGKSKIVVWKLWWAYIWSFLRHLI